MEKKNNLKIFSSQKNIEIQSICYGLNLFLPTFLLIISSLFKEYILAAELGILIGVNIIFTQIFSANCRSIIISNNNTKDIYSFLIFRFIISIFILCTNIILFYYYNFTYAIVLILVVGLILIQWNCELILTFYEIKNQNNNFYQYLIISLFFCILVIINFITSSNLEIILKLFNIFFLIFLFIGILKIKKKIFPVKKFIIKVFKSPAFFSSLTISVSNLIWRIFIITFCGKIIAGIYFASFAIGSLPGTLFNNSFGPSMIKKNLKIKNFKLFYILVCLIIFLLFMFTYFNIDKIFLENQITQLFGTSLSLLGSIFMVKGLYFRQYIIQKTSFKSHVFKYDIFYAMIIGLIVPFLFFLGGIRFVIISFLVSSLISFLMYRNLFLKLNNKY